VSHFSFIGYHLVFMSTDPRSLGVRQPIKRHPGPVMVRGYLSVRATGGAAEALANDWRGLGSGSRSLLTVRRD
jgi:hypothetical protein